MFCVSLGEEKSIKKMTAFSKKEIESSIIRFNDLSSDLLKSDNNTFNDRLSQFFFFAENDNVFKYIHLQLINTSNADINEWYNEKLSMRSSMVGSAPLEFPQKPENRLSIQYQLLYSIYKGDIDYSEFMLNFIGSRLDVYLFNEAVSLQLFREINHKIENLIRQVSAEKPILIDSKKQNFSEDSKTMVNNRKLWEGIHNTYGISKNSFGRKISFVTDTYRRTTIFRDIGHAYYLSTNGFSKPAVILVGSVVEELLRLFLIHKGISISNNDNYNKYIKLCESNELLKTGINRLSDSVRHFRNYVHLSKEIDKKHAISKSTAIGAVASIFTLANDF